MTKHSLSASKLISAPAQIVHDLTADYRNGYRVLADRDLVGCSLPRKIKDAFMLDIFEIASRQRLAVLVPGLTAAVRGSP